MHDTGIIGVLAGLPASDMDTSIDWLSTVLGTGPSARPMPILADWYLPGGTLQLVHDERRAGGGMVTVHVTDIGAVRDRLGAAGIEFGYDETSSERVAFASLTDPDGNSITFVQAKEGFSPQG